MSFPSSNGRVGVPLSGAEISVLLLQAPLDLPELLHYAGLMPIRPQVPRLIIESAHRAVTLSSWPIFDSLSFVVMQVW